MRTFLLVALMCLPAAARSEVQFENRADAIPEHVYSGGWEHFVGGGVAVFDCNADGLADLYLAGGAGPAQLWINRSDASGISFAAQDNSAGIEGVTGAYPLDVDGDGWLDLMVLRVGPNRLLRGGPDCAFTDAPVDWGFSSEDRWSTAFSAIWEAGQARPTFAIGNYVDRADPDGPFEACDVNELYRPEGTAYRAPMLLEPGFCALSMLFSDWDRQGRQDLRISNDRHYYVRGGHEQMWRLDQARFLGKEDGWTDISIWGMGIASEDITGDGRPEVVLTSMGDQLMQIAGEDGYTAAPFDIGTYAQRPFLGDDGRPSTGWQAEFGDVNNDGRADLFIAKGNVDQMPSNAMYDPNNLLIQQPDGRFVEVADVAGVATTERSRGAALVDLNADGLLDLVVVNRRAAVEVYQNVTADAGGFVFVALRKETGNTRAVGAWVELRTAAGQVATKEVTVGGGHVGGKSVPLHFGIGAEDHAEVRAIWPDGSATDWKRVAAGATVTLR